MTVKNTSWLSARTQSILKQFFEWVGYRAHTHPCRFIILGAFITFLCGLGALLAYKHESDAVELYIPTDSEIYAQYLETKDLFGEFVSRASVLVGNKKQKEGLLSPNHLNNLFSIYYYPTYNLSINFKKREWDFIDLCERPYPDFLQCNSELESVFALFGNDPSLWQDQETINAYISTQEAQEVLGFFMGGLEYNGSLIVNGTYMRIDWTLQSTSNNTIYDAIWEWMLEFQDYFGKNGKDFEKEYKYDISYLTDRTISDEVDRVVGADGPVYAAAIFTMLIYLSFTLGECTKIGARPYLAIVTIIVMIASLATGYGLGLLFGYELSNIAYLLPYLILGVGVDDEIIIVEGVDATPYSPDDESNGGMRFTKALKYSGVSITLTSCCTVMAFAVGSSVTLPGISAFCVFAALAFLANYVLQFLIFLPCFTIDERRKHARRNFCCPFIVYEEDKAITDTASTTDLTTKDTNDTTDAGGVVDTVDTNDNDNDNENENDDTLGHAQPNTKVPTTLPLEEDNEGEENNGQSNKKDDDGRIEVGVKVVIRDIILPLVEKQECRIIIIIIFGALLFGSMVLWPFMNTNSDTKNLVPDDSFAIDYIDAIDDAYPGQTYSEIEIILKKLDFSDNQVRRDIHSMNAEFNVYDDGEARIIGTVDNWLEDFEIYVYENYEGNKSNLTGSKILDQMNSTEFYTTLKEFENDTVTHGAQWDQEIIFDNQQNPTKIKATKFFMNFAKPSLVSDEWPMRNALNKVIDKHLGSKHGYVYSVNFPFAYFEKSVVPLCIENVLFASIGVFCILVLLMDIRMAIFVIIIVLMINVCLFGWIVITNLSLDSLAFLQLIMAVGLTVDYVIHITHAIIDAKVPVGTHPDDEYNVKLRMAMLDMGVGVVKGAFTTFLGLIPLIFSQSRGFRRFSYIFFGIIIIALAHGVLFVPSALAQIPFLWKDMESDEDEVHVDCDPICGKFTRMFEGNKYSRQASSASISSISRGGDDKIGDGQL